MTADFSNLSPVSSDPAQFHGLIGVTTQGDARLFAPSAFGTVSSVGLSVPTGLTVSGSPVTTSGTIALAFAPGYGIPTTVRQSEWDAAYNDKINTATFNTTNGILTLTQQDGGTITINLDGRYLTSFTESDPVFSASPAAGITAPQISNWDTAFGWGNHAVAGYLLSSTAASTYQPLDGDLTAIGALAGTTGLLRKTAADTWSLDTATYLQSSEIGSTILAYDANLQSFVNTFTLPTTDGTSGQVLTTNGAGVISFTTVSGGSSGFDYIQSTPTPPATTAGQLWYKPTDGSHPGTTGLWRSTGAYWVSETANYIESASNVSVTNTSMNTAIQGAGTRLITSLSRTSHQLQQADNSIRSMWLESVSFRFYSIGTGQVWTVDANNSFKVQANINANFNQDLYDIATFNNAAQLPTNDKQLAFVVSPKALILSQTGDGTAVESASVVFRNVAGTPSISGGSNFHIGVSFDFRKVHP